MLLVFENGVPCLLFDDADRVLEEQEALSKLIGDAHPGKWPGEIPGVRIEAADVQPPQRLSKNFPRSHDLVGYHLEQHRYEFES